IFMKRSKGAFRLKSPRLSRVASSGCWKYLREIGVRPRLRSDRRASWLDLASDQWQPSYLWQEWKRRAPFDSDPRQKAFKAGPSGALRKARKNFNNRPPH